VREGAQRPRSGFFFGIALSIDVLVSRDVVSRAALLFVGFVVDGEVIHAAFL
jgi:hypothetical protein